MKIVWQNFFVFPARNTLEKTVGVHAIPAVHCCSTRYLYLQNETTVQLKLGCLLIEQC